MRVSRPTWFEPVDSLGEWIGLIGGLAIAGSVLVFAIWIGVRVTEGRISSSELTCIDPTDPCNWSSYRVRNNSGAKVVLRECMHRCDRGDQRLDPVRINPGQTTQNDVYVVSASVGGRDWWEVRSNSGRLLGCLVLDGHRDKHDGDLVLISAARPCSNSATTPVATRYAHRILFRLR